MTPIPVNADTFARAESDRMFAAIAAQAGGTGRWNHNRVPTPLDEQTVIRMNRDTLYSAAVVDLAEGVTVTIPDPGDRYLSVMVLDRDHFVTHVLHEPGDHDLSLDDVGTDFAVLAARVLVDPADPADVAAVNALQDGFGITTGSDRPFLLPDYDAASLDATRGALLELARGLDGFAGSFGRRDEVDPVHHLIGSAAGWGGLPESEAFYANVEPGLPVGEYQLTVRDVPVDAFWSISLYDRDGFFVPSDRGACSVNSITAEPDDDGSITVRFGGDGSRPNTLAIMDGWNYLVRFYRPRPEVVDRSWSFPLPEPVPT